MDKPCQITLNSISFPFRCDNKAIQSYSMLLVLLTKARGRNSSNGTYNK